MQPPDLKAQFALRKLTPGAVFALFGMSIVAIMLYLDTPEFRRETRQDESALVMRGGASHTFHLPAADERASVSLRLRRARSYCMELPVGVR
jgi:hypothetical protein